MARQTFTAGQVLTAAQMTTLQSSVWSDDVNAQTTSYTLVLTDAGKQVAVTSASATTLTIPLNSSVAFSTGVKVSVINLGAGVLTLAGAGGVTLSSASTDFTLSQYGVAFLIKTGTDTWVCFRSTESDDDQSILPNQIFG